MDRGHEAGRREAAFKAAAVMKEVEGRGHTLRLDYYEGGQCSGKEESRQPEKWKQPGQFIWTETINCERVPRPSKVARRRQSDRLG